MEEIARVYADALFGAAKDAGKLDAVRDQLGQFAGAVDQSRELAVFLFSPYFSSAEKRDGLGRVVSGAEPELMRFLGLLVEKHRMPAIFRIRRRFEKMWAEENRLLDVEVTTAIEIGEQVVKRIGAAIEQRTGRRVNLVSRVDEHILGGLVLRVGNRVLDASIRNRLEKLRKQVARAA